MAAGVSAPFSMALFKKHHSIPSMTSKVIAFRPVLFLVIFDEAQQAPFLSIGVGQEICHQNASGWQDDPSAASPASSMNFLEETPVTHIKGHMKSQLLDISRDNSKDQGLSPNRLKPEPCCPGSWSAEQSYPYLWVRMCHQK